MKSKYLSTVVTGKRLWINGLYAPTLQVRRQYLDMDDVPTKYLSPNSHGALHKVMICGSGTQHQGNVKDAIVRAVISVTRVTYFGIRNGVQDDVTLTIPRGQRYLLLV